jgi:hypothetical protein
MAAVNVSLMAMNGVSLPQRMSTPSRGLPVAGAMNGASLPQWRPAASRGLRVKCMAGVSNCCCDSHYKLFLIVVEFTLCYSFYNFINAGEHQK